MSLTNVVLSRNEQVSELLPISGITVVGPIPDEGARDATWILELEQAITVRQITDQMDPWTKKTWQARQFGYSWKEIAARLGLSEQAAKKKFEYGLEKTRQRIVGLLKTGRVKESA